MTEQTITTESLYAKKFARLQAEGRKAFIPFTLLGWPSPDESLEIIRTMIESGATALELGLPFSDPMADGPVIQQAAQEALQNGFKVEDGLTLVRQVRGLSADIPIGLLVYYNLVLARGADHFFREFAEAGVNGVLVADLPPEAAHELHPVARQYGIDLIFIVSPLTTPQRLKHILTYAGGFLYIVSRLGITGVEARYDTALQDLISGIKDQAALPACVGFGISTPEQARSVIELGADGVITGSRIIQLVRENMDSYSASLRDYLESMVNATI